MFIIEELVWLCMGKLQVAVDYKKIIYSENKGSEHQLLFKSFIGSLITAFQQSCLSSQPMDCRSAVCTKSTFSSVVWLEEEE